MVAMHIECKDKFWRLTHQEVWPVTSGWLRAP